MAKNFLEAYRQGEPVGDCLPSGGLYGVVAFLIGENGISYMDDSCLDDMPTRHADHHLCGPPQFEGPDIILNGHRFHALEGDNARRWNRMFGDRSVRDVRDSAEKLLRQLTASNFY